MTTPFDKFLGPVTARPTAPFPAATPFDSYLSGGATPFDRFLPRDLTNDPLARGAVAAGDLAVSGLNTVGKVLQPFQSLQQGLYGVIGEASGDRGALGRGLSAGAGYLTYGATEYLPGQKGARERNITGRELFKNLGAPDWAATAGGTLADVFLDPANLFFGAGAAARVAGAGRTAQALTNAGEVLGRVGPAGVPVRDAFRLLPAGTREALARTSYRYVYGAELPVGMFPGMKAVTGVSRASVLETFVPPTIAARLAPADEARRIAFQDDVKKRSLRVLEEYSRRRDTARNAWEEASRRLPAPARQELDRIASRLTDAPDRAESHRARMDLRALGAAHNDPALEDRAMRALGASMAFRLWSGQNLVRVGNYTQEDMLRGMAFPGGRLNPDQDRRGLRRMFSTFGEDADAHIARVLADNRPPRVEVDVPRLEQSVAVALAGRLQGRAPAVLARSMEAFAQARANANTPTTLGDVLADAAQTHNLTAQDVADLAQHLTGTRRAGAVEFQGAYQTAERLRARRNLEPTGGGPGSGQAAVGASRVSAREDISERTLQDYGQIESVRAQITTQAQVVGQVVARKQALLELRQFAEQEGLVYSRLTQRAAEGQIDRANLPPAVVNRPEDPRYLKAGGGWRTVTDRQAQGLDGVFEAGDVVPDWLHRALTVGSVARDGLGLPVTYRRMLTIWKATKLGNPGTVVQNAVSGLVDADRYGFNLAQVTRGAVDYLRRTPAQQDELMRAGIGGMSQVDTEVRLEAQRILAAQAGRRGLDALNNIVSAALSFLEESTGARPGALPPGPARFVARLNPGRSLLALNGATDTFIRGSVYMAARRAGRSAAEAADIGENVLLDYVSRPLAAEFASRSGLSPFETYRTLSTWRLIENLYDRPFRLVRSYRLADSVARTTGLDDPETRRRELAAMPDYVREKLPIPLFKDDEGRTYYAPLSAFLPEGSATDIIDDVNSTNIFGVIPVPPKIGLYKQIFEGVGFRGQNIYKGLTDKGGLFEAAKMDPVEATRRALKALYQFGAYPWAPGSPTSERLARAIAYAAQPEEGEPGELQTQILRFLKEGPFGYADGSLSVRGDTKYGEPPITLPMAVARSAFGLKAYPVQGEMSQVGAANWKVQGAQRELADLTSRYRDLIAKANPVDRPRLLAEAKAALEKAQEVRALVQGLR